MNLYSPFVLSVIVLIHASGIALGQVDLFCVPLHHCPQLLNLLRVQPISFDTLQVLKASECGFDGREPYLWCAQPNNQFCYAPDGVSGNCVPAKQCAPFIKLLQSPTPLSATAINYLQGYQCENALAPNEISICCPAEKDSFRLLGAQEIPRPSFIPHPDRGECGLQLYNKIIGGKVTEMDEFPWTALLLYQYRGRSSTPCAGTLISRRYIVTAAHCVDNAAIRSVGQLTHVILGEYDIRTERDCLNSLGIEDCADLPIRVPVEEIIVHPQWYTRPRAQVDNDIALIRLALPVPYTNYIKPICLPSSTLSLKENEDFVVTGWGQTENGTASFVKLKTSVPLADKIACISTYRREKKLEVGEGQICVGAVEGKDTCTGDSGGPLMLPVNRNPDRIWYLAGVVSFGFNQPCGDKNYPALYTFLPNYIEWIYDTVRP